MKEASEDAQAVRQQLNSCLVLAKQQVEELEKMKKYKKLINQGRVTSITLIGAGVLMIGLSQTPMIDKGFKDSLFKAGVITAGAGAVVGISITIPF